MSYEHQLLKQPSISRIAIVRALPGLGDLLCTVPAKRAIRAAFPQAHITLIGLPWARSFIERFSHYLDDFLEFPGYPGIPEVPFSAIELLKFLTSVQGQFDLVLQMHGNGIVINAFTALLGARFNAGFYLPGYYCPDANYFMPYPDSEPEIWRHLRLMDFLGIPLQGEQLEWTLRSCDFVALQELSEISGISSNYVCIHPGASTPDKRWALESFALVADAIAARGLQIVLTGTATEVGLTEALALRMRFKPINLAGRTSLGTMAALLSQAKLLICNDTGVSHLAAAVKVKSVVIFSNSDSHRWAPLDREMHRSLSYSKNIDGAYVAVSPEMVIAQVDELLPKEVSNVA